ncbi:hypothetical protein NP233_g2030 [Leucocoprinus birnbaumii]|uniref:F-box domain-containing protein n=1 Tax=Leucocoprinus birnbaumii TaxID=56174 RepID=A0AAD5W502_9AGAR|nr:hypothetical protein NP233_g2030 [Leucocoprinus birnbaumii]
MPAIQPAITPASLRTIRSLTDCEITAVHGFLDEGQNRIQSLDIEIGRLQNLHSSLRLKTQQLLSFIASHNSLISPLNRLPPDILQDIFYHCLPIAHNATMSVDLPPLSLARVSKRWRNVIYSSPRLWTTLHIVAIPFDVPFHAQSSRANLDAIESWINRSGVLPISISMYHDTQSSSLAARMRTYQVKPYFDIIARHSHRLKSLYFILRDVDWVQLLSPFSSSDFPKLESLCIKDHHESISWDDPSDSRAANALAQDKSLLRAPQLRCLDLPSYLGNRLGEKMQWQNLTSLYVSYWSIQFGDFVRIASQCPNLSECLIRLSYIYAWPDSINDPPNGGPLNFTLPNLRNLMILGTHDDDPTTSDLFRRISTPSLTHLTWKRSSRREPWSFTPLSYMEEEMLESLKEFLSRLVAPLEGLGLWLDPISGEALVGILKCVPGLKRLSTGGFVRPSALPRRRWRRDTPDGYPPFPIPYSFDDTILLGLIPGRMSQIDAALRAHPVHYDFIDEPYDLPCLCPQLEIVRYFSLAKFCHKDLLELVRSRTLSHHKNEVAHLRYISIIFPFSAQPLGLYETEESELLGELEVLGRETGVWVNIEHTSDEAIIQAASDLREGKRVRSKGTVGRAYYASPYVFGEQMLDRWGDSLSAWMSENIVV